jgi:plasmid replication initiation protein
VEAKYKLRLEEQRLILYLISIIEPGDKEFNEYKISVSDFCKYTGLSKDSAYDKFIEMSESLVSKTIRIKEGESVTTLAWLAQTTYHKGQGYITLCFAPKLKPYLLELKKNFTSYAIENVLRLKSIYSIRFYELLKQYEKIGKRKFEVSELKSTLNVSEFYTRYYDLKKYTILVAQKELKEKCDICFEFEEIKTGRRVTEIVFFIHKNQNSIKLYENMKKL